MGDRRRLGRRARRRPAGDRVGRQCERRLRRGWSPWSAGDGQARRTSSGDRRAAATDWRTWAVDRRRDGRLGHDDEGDTVVWGTTDDGDTRRLGHIERRRHRRVGHELHRSELRAGHLDEPVAMRDHARPRPSDRLAGAAARGAALRARRDRRAARLALRRAVAAAHAVRDPAAVRSLLAGSRA